MDPSSTTLKDKNLGMYLIRLSWDTYYLIVSSLEEENLTERRGSNGSRNFDLGRLKLVEEFEGEKFRGKKKEEKKFKSSTHRSILSIVVGCWRMVCCPDISTTHCVPSSSSEKEKWCMVSRNAEKNWGKLI